MYIFILVDNERNAMRQSVNEKALLKNVPNLNLG